ncbi:MAG: hypothetical protein E5V74_01315 [Mesorhizobium sp.]|nr:MAG: hypothetical protein E5W02_02300 [Mesorhizobium sp.]TIV65472.1 MAG: hypothetical protein E5V86_11865 [Mesorhizobium sp.]TIW05824.1 MAG: hypothetical protein E5V74_01315 [Mesorhizobium sp.]
MRYFDVRPDVAGGLGDHTILDNRVHPPIVHKLHYEIEGWFGDALVTTFPCFLVTEEAKQALLNMGISGANFADAEITVSDEFHELQPGQHLPEFVWLKVDGRAGHDDFGIASNYDLVISQRVLDLFERLGIPSAVIEPFNEKKL